MHDEHDDPDACDAIAKGLANSLRKKYTHLRVVGHPAPRNSRDSIRPSVPRALISIKDITNQHGLYIQIATGRDNSIIVIRRRIKNGNASKWQRWFTLDLFRPDSLDYMETRIMRDLHDISELWKGRI